MGEQREQAGKDKKGLVGSRESKKVDFSVFSDTQISMASNISYQNTLKILDANANSRSHN